MKNGEDSENNSNEGSSVQSLQVPEYGSIESVSRNCPSLSWTIPDYNFVEGKKSPTFVTRFPQIHLTWSLLFVKANQLQLRQLNKSAKCLIEHNKKFSGQICNMKGECLKTFEYNLNHQSIDLHFFPNSLLRDKCRVNEATKVLKVIVEIVKMPGEFHLPSYQPLTDSYNHSKLKKFCDMILVAEDKEFPVHQVVLASHSSVFYNWFQDSSNHREKKLIIYDIKSNVLDAVITFIYTNKLRLVETNVEDLLASAEKFKLGELKKVCEEILSDSLNSDNSITHLILADKYKATYLKKNAIGVIAANLNVLLRQPDFEMLHQECNTHLMKELLSYLSFTYPIVIPKIK